MSSSLRKKLRRFLLRRLGLWEAERFGRVSFAQEGEDVLLWRLLDAHHDKTGVYVEVGSNHPWKCSNTAFFYQRGWSGVAIDPNPDFAPLFARERPRDVFLNVGVDDAEGELLYHRFDEPLLNTFSTEKAAEVLARAGRRKVDEVKVKVLPLGTALAGVWPEGRAIDLLSIDAEGMDERVVSGHDFARYPAAHVIVEFDSPILAPGAEPAIVGLLRDRGYLFVSKLFKSGLFVHRDAARRLGLA